MPKTLSQQMAETAASLGDQGQTVPLSQRMAQTVASLNAPTFDPTQGMSGFEKFAAGMGKAVYDSGRGLGQLARQGLEAVGAKHAADSVGLPTQADIDDAKRLDAPLNNTAAGIAGNVAGQAAMVFLPGGAIARASKAAGMARLGAAAEGFVNPATYTGAAVSGALQNSLRPVASDESRLGNTLTGAASGVVGNGLINGIGRVAQPVANVLPAVGNRSVQILRDAGVPLDAAQQTGSALLNRVKGSLFDNPMTAGAQRAVAAGQQSGYNAAVLRTIGENAPAATPEVLGAAQSRINGVIGDILDRNNVTVDYPTLNRFLQVQQSAADVEKKPIVNMTNRIFDSLDGNGQMPGQVAYGIKKDLDRMSSSADSDLAHHARALNSVLKDTIGSSLSGEDQVAFNQARSQFANMKKVEGAVNENGDISPARLWQTLNTKRNAQVTKYGNGPQDLVDLARAGKQVMGSEPNSGTAARAAALGLPMALAGGAGYFSYDDDHKLSAAGKAAAVAALPFLMQRGLNNPAMSSYLVNGIEHVPLRSMLTAPQSNAAIGGVVRQLPMIPIRNFINAPAPQE